MKHLLIVLVVVASFNSCANNANDKNTPKVYYKGALKDIMRKGDISAKADLKKFEKEPNFYALGANENLKGEIQIFNSNPYNTYVKDSTLMVDKSFNKKAALLVYASVKKWKPIIIPSQVETYKQLESFIEKKAKEEKINTEEPFPFLVEGKMKSFDWHVINWKEGDTEHSHTKHVNSGLHNTKKYSEVNLLGFYSNAHHAIFTHHTTNMHVHVKTNDGEIAGHLDDLFLGNEMVLKLPEL